jgi:hypothetical protein
MFSAWQAAHFRKHFDNFSFRERLGTNALSRFLSQFGPTIDHKTSQALIR